MAPAMGTRHLYSNKTQIQQLWSRESPAAPPECVLRQCLSAAEQFGVIFTIVVVILTLGTLYWALFLKGQWRRRNSFNSDDASDARPTAEELQLVVRVNSKPHSKSKNKHDVTRQERNEDGRSMKVSERKSQLPRRTAFEPPRLICIPPPPPPAYIVPQQSLQYLIPPPPLPLPPLLPPLLPPFLLPPHRLPYHFQSSDGGSNSSATSESPGSARPSWCWRSLRPLSPGRCSTINGTDSSGESLASQVTGAGDEEPLAEVSSRTARGTTRQNGKALLENETALMRQNIRRHRGGETKEEDGKAWRHLAPPPNITTERGPSEGCSQLHRQDRLPRTRRRRDARPTSTPFNDNTEDMTPRIGIQDGVDRHGKVIEASSRGSDAWSVQGTAEWTASDASNHQTGCASATHSAGSSASQTSTQRATMGSSDASYEQSLTPKTSKNHMEWDHKSQILQPRSRHGVLAKARTLLRVALRLDGDLADTMREPNRYLGGRRESESSHRRRRRSASGQLM